MSGLSLRALGVTYAYRRDEAVLKGVDVSVSPGSFLAVLGVNGCGKSTLLSCMDGLVSPQQGRILIGEDDMALLSRDGRAKAVSMVAQRSYAGRLTVFDAVLLGRRPHITGAPREEDLNAVHSILCEMGLEKHALHYVDELSGGEFQKAMIARALVQETDVILLDEPTSNLDPANQQEVMKLVRRLVDEKGKAVAIVLHDINLALRYCDRFAMMRSGEVVVSGGVEVVNEASIKEVYGMDVDVIVHAGCKIVVPR